VHPWQLSRAAAALVRVEEAGAVAVEVEHLRF